MYDVILTHITKFYGLDWVGIVASGAFFYLVGNKNRLAFPIGMIAAVCWGAQGWIIESYPQVAINIFVFGMHIRGYLKWGK